MNTCTATHRKIVRSWGTATEFGHKECGAPATKVRQSERDAGYGRTYSVSVYRCDDHADADYAPIAPEPTEDAPKLTIEPRGTVYRNDGSLIQWTRVINGTVYHFALAAPSDYWKVGVTCKVSSHPYGDLGAKTVVHENMAVAEYAA
jgi:hypothetical protein